MSDENAVTVMDQLPHSLEEIKQYAGVFVQSGMFPDMKTLSGAMAKIIAGREMGIPPFTALRGLNIIQGKPELSAGLMSSLVKTSGKYDYVVGNWDDRGCGIEFFEKRKGEWKSIGHSRFTEEEAKMAGLFGTGNWKKYPRAMYFARAMSQGARAFCPDIFLGAIYVDGELTETPEPRQQKAVPSRRSHQVDALPAATEAVTEPVPESTPETMDEEMAKIADEAYTDSGKKLKE